MDPSWIEFQAEKETIHIVPNFTATTLCLLQGDVGPFKAGIPLEVPLWIGLNLRQRQKCRFIQPDWMTVDNLDEVKEAEKQTLVFTQLPDQYMFVKGQLIMDVGNNDLTRPDEVRTTIKDIWDIRQSKLRFGENP
jgi:GINS complex subunit 2